MKKKMILCVSLILLFVLTACGNNTVHAGGVDKDTFAENINSSETLESEFTENEADDKWGVDENTITEKNDKKVRAHIKFPNLCGIVEGTGKIAYQPDESLVLLGSEIDFNEPEIEGNKIENIFPAYFIKVAEIMEAYRGAKYKDFEFEITSKETVNVNGYEMCKYTGKHTFASRKDNYEMNFVAYATRLKGNDAVVYWMVLDETDDQILSDVIESHADKMAQTLHE
mgnify:CR=1 FL=1